MVELKVYLSDDMNMKFRRIAMTVYGYGRGSLSKAAGEAFANWCNEHDGAPKKANTSSSAETAGEQMASATSGINPDERPHESEKPVAGEDNGSSHNSSQRASLSGASPIGKSQNISISWKPDTDNRVECHG